MDFTIADFKVGQRVQLHPATDLWMKGARFGDVAKVGKSLVHVYIDRLEEVVTVMPHNIGEIL